MKKRKPKKIKPVTWQQVSPIFDTPEQAMAYQRLLPKDGVYRIREVPKGSR